MRTVLNDSPVRLAICLSVQPDTTSPAIFASRGGRCDAPALSAGAMPGTARLQAWPFAAWNVIRWFHSRGDRSAPVPSGSSAISAVGVIVIFFQGSLEVLLNLAGNALDAMASTDGAVLTFRARRDGDRVRVQVEDNGPGIDEAQMDRLFEPFFTTKPSGQGLGLGLAISASIANALGGSIELQGREDGHPGTVATLSLPVATLTPPPAAALPTIG